VEIDGELMEIWLNEVCDKNKIDVQAFLGFINFYQRFIQDFSAKA